MTAFNQNNAVQFATAVSSPPGIPTVGGGADISSLSDGTVSQRYQRIRLDLNAGAVTLTGPVVLYGEKNSKVYKLGELNSGNDIVLASPGGYAELVQFVGTYDYMGLNPAGVVGGGSYNGFIEGVGSDNS